MDVLSTSDPVEVLHCAEALLSADPVRTNLVGTLLLGRAKSGEQGRFWVVQPSAAVGVALQSPLDFPLRMTPMPDDAADALASAIAAEHVFLPGAAGEAATVARFAGSWSERTRVGAVPELGQRLYEVRHVMRRRAVPGSFRQAVRADREQLIDFVNHFADEIGEPTDATWMVDARLPLGQLWVWDRGGPVSMAALTGAANGVVRVQAVFTPGEHRGFGYASACVAELSQRALDAGHRCVLYTDLGNATSNAIYRAIGYEAVAEALTYRFT